MHVQTQEQCKKITYIFFQRKLNKYCVSYQFFKYSFDHDSTISNKMLKMFNDTNFLLLDRVTYCKEKADLEHDDEQT